MFTTWLLLLTVISKEAPTLVIALSSYAITVQLIIRDVASCYEIKKLN